MAGLFKYLDTSRKVFKYYVPMFAPSPRKHKRKFCIVKKTKSQVRLPTLGKLHSVESAAQFLGGLSVWTIRRWLTDGKLTRYKVGGRTMLLEQELIDMAQPETPAQAAKRALERTGRK